MVVSLHMVTAIVNHNLPQSAGDRPRPAALSLLVFWALANVAMAEPYDVLGSLKATELLRAEELAGEHFRVDERVNTDGFVYIYQLTTDYGPMLAVSTPVLNERLLEVRAIGYMDALRKTDLFAKAVAGGVTAVPKGAVALVKNPVGTVADGVRGVGAFFRRTGDVLFARESSNTEDSRAKQLVGFSVVKRKLASKLDVDPYSRNMVMISRLNELAWIAFSANIGVGAALATVPIPSSPVVTNIRRVRKYNRLLRDLPPTDLRRENRRALLETGIDKDTVELFIANPVFTMTEQTIIARTIADMHGVEARGEYVKRAVATYFEDLAEFRRRQINLYARYHAGVAPLARFTTLGGVEVVGQLKGGQVVLCIPADHLYWTEVLETFVDEVDKEIAALAALPGRQIWIGGAVTELAAKELAVRGWAVHADAAVALPSLETRGDDR